MSAATTTDSREEPLLVVNGLAKEFASRHGAGARVRAVDQVSFSIMKGETLALVGESGCGKSTIGRMVMRLIEPTAGSITYGGTELTRLHGKALLPFRRRLQIVFQDPYSSLNPRKTIFQALSEPLKVHRLAKGSELRGRVGRLLELVGMPASYADRYPRELSGGQRQRIGVARALTVNPGLIVCDEPVSSLDASVQAQIVNLLMDLQRELGLSYLFVSHDLLVVRHIARRVAVMYLGRIVETASTEQVFQQPRHPYTRALIDATPTLDGSPGKRGGMLEGELPNPLSPPSGCHFHPRCPHAREICARERPALEELSGGGSVACHFWRELPPLETPSAADASPATTRMRRLKSAFQASPVRMTDKEVLA